MGGHYDGGAGPFVWRRALKLMAKVRTFVEEGLLSRPHSESRCDAVIAGLAGEEPPIAVGSNWHRADIVEVCSVCFVAMSCNDPPAAEGCNFL